MRLLNWRLSAFNLIVGVVRLFGLPARVSCMTEALGQVRDVRDVLVLVCAEGAGAIQLTLETEPAS